MLMNRYVACLSVPFWEFVSFWVDDYDYNIDKWSRADIAWYAPLVIESILVIIEWMYW